MSPLYVLKDKYGMVKIFQDKEIAWIYNNWWWKTRKTSLSIWMIPGTWEGER